MCERFHYYTSGRLSESVNQDLSPRSYRSSRILREREGLSLLASSGLGLGVRKEI